MTDDPSLPSSIDATTLALLGRGDYVADRALATALFLALRLGRPLFLEGEAGVGKTEIAKVLAQTLGRRAGAPAMLRGPRRRLGGLRVELSAPDARDPAGRGGRRASTATASPHDIFAERFLIRRPLLQALGRTRRRRRCC